MLADDHAIVRRGLRVLLGTGGDIAIVGEAKNGSEAVRMAGALGPDVILMDIAMPILNGLEATHEILAANPAARVIILSAHTDDEYIKRSVEAGVAGFLEKQNYAKSVATAIREVAAGRPFFSPYVAKRIQNGVGGPPGQPRKPGSRPPIASSDNSVELTIG